MPQDEDFSQEDLHRNFPGAPSGLRELAETSLKNAPIAGAVGAALFATGIGEAAVLGFGAYMVFNGACKFIRHSMREKITNDYQASLNGNQND